MGNNRQDLFCSSFFEEVCNTLYCKEYIRMLCLPESIKEEREIVMVVQGLQWHLEGEKKR